MLKWIFAALLSTAVSADELMLGMWSKHWDATTQCGQAECRSHHELVGYAGKDWFAGTFENSLNNRSYFAGWKSEPKCLYASVCLDLLAGAATGYGDLMPFIAPRVRIGPIQIFGVPGVVMAAGVVVKF